MRKENILIWLASPLGDAVLSTPALRAIRQHYKDSKITLLANKVVQDTLTPCDFCDDWIEYKKQSPLRLAAELKKHNFDQAVLFKNSFGSALTIFLTGIKSRVGYSRDNRSFLLTDELYPAKLPNRKFKPLSMIDYYLTIATYLGADTSDRKIHLDIDPNDTTQLQKKLPQLTDSKGPVVILVPGGAFGLSKCWPSERFAQTADNIIEQFNATVIVSVAPNNIEKKIAQQICDTSKNNLINLADTPLSLGQLKALFSKADLVITNDTGPRHIAIALDKKVITMFGPNDPLWTLTGHEKEVQIIGRAHCAPCLKPECYQAEHLCMNSISTDRVTEAAKRLLNDEDYKSLSDKPQQFQQLSNDFFIDTDYIDLFQQAGLTKISSIFKFKQGDNLSKKNLAKYRSRMKFELGRAPVTFFLKRYKKPPLDVQLDKWICNHGITSCGLFDTKPTRILNAAGINTPRIIAYGQQMDLIFENRSFIITEKIPNSKSLEEKLPEYFYSRPTIENLNKRRKFIQKLAALIRTFHNTGFRHRDLYLCHIFCDENENFTLIDLARTFKPLLLGEKYRIKDIAQLYYSAPGNIFTKKDRLRFYKHYINNKKLSGLDEEFIKEVLKKVKQMARHDKKHNRPRPYKLKK